MAATSRRCELFEQIATETWAEVIQQRRTGPEPMEVGITSRIISKIRAEFQADRRVGIWSNNAYRESEYGSDIDVFVEISPSRFVWYALQAKVQKITGKYEAVCYSKEQHQWDQLIRLQELSGCIPYYLLYNGESSFTGTHRDSCGRTFSADQFGCSLVSVHDMRDVSLDERGICRPPYFEDLHPDMSHPWRILTCCLRPGSVRTYALQEVEIYTGPYELLSDGLPTGFGDIDPPIFNAAQSIRNYANQVEREPDEILLFRRTNRWFRIFG